MAFRPLPRRSTRGSKGYTFFEAFLALGPQEIGDTGQNTLSDLIGRIYLLLLTEDHELQLYRKPEGGHDWARVTSGLPTVFDSTQPTTRRRFSIAFDQSARAIVAYEEGSTVYLTRWDTTANGGSGGYVQNVTIPGVDPVVLSDATLTFVVPDSDVLLFYLSTDRLEVRHRVQREVYGTERTAHTYAEPVILDRAISLPWRYELLVSDAAGDPLTEMLISDLYPVRQTQRQALAVSITNAETEVTTTKAGGEEGALFAVSVPSAGLTGSTSLRDEGPETGIFVVSIASSELVSSATQRGEGPEVSTFATDVVSAEAEVTVSRITGRETDVYAVSIASAELRSIT